MYRSEALAAALLACAVASAPTAAETPLERGTYLMQSIVACGNCHTPKGPDGELPGMELAGGFLIEMEPFTVYPPNITPDKETGIGNWTDAQLIAAIREGRRPDGSIIGPPMPIEFYRKMSDEDVTAIVAYLRAVKPVSNRVQKTVYRIPLPKDYGPPVGHVTAPSRDDKVAYGEYLATIGHCMECHTPMGDNGQRDYADRLGAGGEEFPGPWGVSYSANITPTGLKDYTDAQLKTIITTGVRPNGTKLLPPMAIPYYAKMTEADLDALVAYLRTLPAR